jgi:hypothetical protein
VGKATYYGMQPKHDDDLDDGKVNVRSHTRRKSGGAVPGRASGGRADRPKRKSADRKPRHKEGGGAASKAYFNNQPMGGAADDARFSQFDPESTRLLNEAIAGRGRIGRPEPEPIYWPERPALLRGPETMNMPAAKLAFEPPSWLPQLNVVPSGSIDVVGGPERRGGRRASGEHMIPSYTSTLTSSGSTPWRADRLVGFAVRTHHRGLFVGR